MPVAAVSTLALAVFTALSLVARSWWVADICANLRIQWLIGIAGIAVSSILFRYWKLLTVQFAVAVLNLWFVSSTWKSEPAASARELLTVATVNVYSGNTNFETITRLIRQQDADLVAVLELTTGLAGHLQQALSTTHPYAFVLPQNNGNFGIGLYSKHPFDSVSPRYFTDETIPSIVANVKIAEQAVTMIATHPLPPMGPGAFHQRNEHLRMLAAFVRNLQSAAPDTPVVVAGDLNLTPWSPIFADFLDAGKLQSFPRQHGFTPTWYRYNVFPCGLILDHVLATDDLKCIDQMVGPNIGSDHRMVTVRLGRKTTVTVRPNMNRQ